MMPAASPAAAASPVTLLWDETSLRIETSLRSRRRRRTRRDGSARRRARRDDAGAEDETGRERLALGVRRRERLALERDRAGRADVRPAGDFVTSTGESVSFRTPPVDAADQPDVRELEDAVDRRDRLAVERRRDPVAAGVDVDPRVEGDVAAADVAAAGGERLRGRLEVGRDDRRADGDPSETPTPVESAIASATVTARNVVSPCCEST